jgi:hypothetical protein
MKQFIIMSNEKTGAILLIKETSSDYDSYKALGFCPIFKGTKRECIAYVDEYFDENFIPDEERIFLTAA